MTNTQTEIACSLTEPEFRSRKNVCRRKLKPYLNQETYSERSSQLVFSKTEITRQLLEQLIELESKCCPFLDFDLTETDRYFQLSVTGPEGCEDMVRNFSSESDGSGCGCLAKDQLSSLKKPKYIIGFLTLCAIACAAAPLLTAIGLIGVATGAWFGKGIEAVLITLTLSGLGYLLLNYAKKRRRRTQL